MAPLFRISVNSIRPTFWETKSAPKELKQGTIFLPPPSSKMNLPISHSTFLLQHGARFVFIPGKCPSTAHVLILSLGSSSFLLLNYLTTFITAVDDGRMWNCRLMFYFEEKNMHCDVLTHGLILF
jgi:hypothetical protein